MSGACDDGFGVFGATGVFDKEHVRGSSAASALEMTLTMMMMMMMMMMMTMGTVVV